jgi:hypothetical protein
VRKGVYFPCLVLGTWTAIYAQIGVTGKWQAEIPRPGGGNARITLDVIENGTELAGTVTLDQSNPEPIQKGKVDHGQNVVQFTLVNPNSRNGTIIFIGKVLGEKIAFWFASVRGSNTKGISFTATRVK